MPKALIIFYSRTGTTRRLAGVLAEALSADRAEIRCRRYDGGVFSYLRAGYDSVKGNLPAIETTREVTGTYDLAVLGAPIWTSHPAVPLRAFLATAPPLPARTGLFLSYGGHSPPETAVKETEDLLPGPLAASLAVKGRGLDEDALARFAAELTAPAGTTD